MGKESHAMKKDKVVTDFYHNAKLKKCFGDDEKRQLGKFLYCVRQKSKGEWKCFCHKIPFSKRTANRYIEMYLKGIDDD